MDKDIMTDEEGEYWDDYFTRNPPKVDPAKNRILTGEGPVARMTLSNRIVGNLDSDVIQYICAQAIATGETQSQVASAIIRRELTKSA
jgi:adenylyl- and sulfurtransferase ThiI